MAFIKTTPPDEAEGAVLEMYQRQQLAWGFVPDYAKVFCYRPEVMVRWAKLLAEIRRPLDPRRFELVTFAAAHELQHSTCAMQHGKMLGEIIGDEDVIAIAEGRAAESLSVAEQEIVRFARKVARDAASITAEDVEGLRRNGLSDADIFDVVTTAAARAFFTKVLDALGSPPDSAFSTLNEHLRESLMVGRPIDTQPVAVMPDPD